MRIQSVIATPANVGQEAMTRQKPRKWTKEERQELWTRWHKGESLSAIARALARKPATVREFFLRTGGIEPPARRRRAGSLSLEEREEISRGLAEGLSLRAIARKLGRAPSSLSRDVAQNGGRERYRAAAADRAAWDRARRPKTCKLSREPKLRRLVASKLRKDWSPVQISGWLKAKFTAASRLYVSHETIYRTLFVQARGALKKELIAHLRSNRTMRRAKASSLRGKGRGQIVDAVSISERPPEAEDRAVPGHWEGDLLLGGRSHAVATLVERSTRFVVLAKLDGRDAPSVTKALVKQVSKLPSHLRRSLTWDRGLELAEHAKFTVATGVEVYFCDPQSPWQRGTNENTNRLLRQYLPKGAPISDITQNQLNAIARKLNERPRKTLNFDTPAYRLNVALTG